MGYFFWGGGGGGEGKGGTEGDDSLGKSACSQLFIPSPLSPFLNVSCGICFLPIFFLFVQNDLASASLAMRSYTKRTPSYLLRCFFFFLLLTKNENF